MMSNNFGEILKNLRKERGLTAVKFSKILGIPQNMLSRMEINKTKGIDFDMVHKIYQIFGIEPNQLFGIMPKQNQISKVSIQKVQELEMTLFYVREQFQKLAVQDKRIYEITDVIDSFYLNTEPINGSIQMYFENEIIAGGYFKENEMLYALFLMSFFYKLNYKCKKVALKIQQPEYESAIDTFLIRLSMILRKQATRNIIPYAGFQTEKFYEEFKNLINEAVKALGHKYDEIGNLTDVYIPKEAEELKHITAIYETIRFEGENTKYYDYIAKVYRSVNIYNTVEIQYMVMNLYAQAYTESVLWLKKEDPSGQWCPATPWQIIVKLKIMIPEYFLYWGKKKSF